uniref:C2H2-type domain-containing protein n=1 Tax=Chionoecetes opilio bacilliform virus TaxID=1825681 RepID=A0A1Q3DKY3_9VIRU|nr:hypothetical protein SCV_009 [Chionoecetes opilio bacilliform virus]
MKRRLYHILSYRSQQQQQQPPIEEPKGSIGIFEAAQNNNVLSETNACALVGCHKARVLMMSLRAVINDTVGKRYDGCVFDNRSMRYHAGSSKGYLLDDKLDLYSVHGQTKSVTNRQMENETSLFIRCAEHYIRGGDRSGRIFFTDWIPVVCLMDLSSVTSSNKYLSTTLTSHVRTDLVNPKTPKPLKNISPYNRKPLGKESKFTACFLANPFGAVRWIARRAANARVCLTNAGVALISRRLAQTDRSETIEDLIIKGTITSFKLASNNSCVSVDNNRFFLIDGNYLMGGRLEERNLMTDIFMRCKMKSEKHTVYNSLFSSNTLSAFLATAVEGTTHSQGLALLEHTSSMKNMEVSNRKHKNFWSMAEGDHEEIQQQHRHAVIPRETCELTPPSIYTGDDDYIILRMIYEIAKSAHFIRHSPVSVEEENIDSLTNDPVDTDTTKAALFAMYKCYIECVDQVTGMPRKHAVHLLRSLLNFGGFSNAIATGDGEKSHHLLYSMNMVALNMASKAMIMLVGPSGNNLKTTLVEVLKSCWFELVADLSIGSLNSSNDSTSSTQANLAYISGKKTILVIDEVGYQGAAPVMFGKNSEGAKKDEQNDNVTPGTQKKEESSYGDLSEINASIGLSKSHDSVAVWDKINGSMTASKLKICAQECDEVMEARALAADHNNHSSHTGVKRKRSEVVADEIQQQHVPLKPTTSSHRLLNKDTPMRINAFASTVMWWNCMVGTVMHTLDNGKKTCCNLFLNNEKPFSYKKNIHLSSWVSSMDVHEINEVRGANGIFSRDQVQDALHTSLGNYADKFNVDDHVAMIMLENEGQEVDRASNFMKEVNNMCTSLVTNDSMLKWLVISSVRKDNPYPVLTSVPSSAKYTELLIHISENSSRETIKENHNVLLKDCTRMRTNNMMEKANKNNHHAGFLYMFHAVYSGTLSSPQSSSSKDYQPVEQQIDDTLMGPVLSRINPRNIEQHTSRSDKLSSIIFCGDLVNEVDEDPSNRRNHYEFDSELLKIMENPKCRSFPKVSIDGSCVLPADPDQCTLVLQAIKRNIVDSMKTQDTGTFVAKYIEHCQANPVAVITEPLSIGNMFGAMLENCKTPGSSGSGTNPLTPKSRELYNALKKYKSDGRTTAVSAVASAVASKTDVNSAVTTHMYPGQFDSNMLKKITTKHASSSIRALHCKPVVTSITMTPIMTSNSFLFKFFVDTPLLKRMITFPCNTQFMFPIQNENVDNFIELVDNGMKVVHTLLLLERTNTWGDHNSVQKMANKWLHSWNESVHRGLEHNEYVNDLSAVAALLPARAIEMLVKNSVLEHRDVTSMVKTEESGNTFMHVFTMLTLCSRNEKASYGDDAQHEDEIDDVFLNPTGVAGTKRKRGVLTKPLSFVTRRILKERRKEEKTGKHLQMCNINPKSLSTLTMAVNRCRQGSWPKINAVLNCIVFVDTPFVKTSMLYGDGCNLAMRVPGEKGMHPDLDLGWCIGLRLPNPDMNVKGYDDSNFLGAGVAIMKQTCDVWGTSDIRNIMYSCHHLHMLFELVLQFTHPKRKLPGLSSTKRKNEAGVDYVTVLFTFAIYFCMMKRLKRYPVFETERKKPRLLTSTVNEKDSLITPMEIPMFMSMIVNKPISSMRLSTNLSNMNKAAVRSHTHLVRCIVSRMGHKLNPAYLCDNCAKSN